MRVAAIIVSRDRPDLVVKLVKHLKDMGQPEEDIFVVECGTEEDSIPFNFPNTIWYKDEPFKGKCFGHYVGYQYAKALGRDYRYYWFLHNDVRFSIPRGTPNPLSPVKRLVSILQRTALGIVSPCEPDGPYPDCKPSKNIHWHYVTTCDYLAPMMSAEMLEVTGPLNPAFRYCWGAIHELAYKAYKNGWRVGYADIVYMTHFGGSTYGKAKGTVSREEYQRRAKKFAAEYFVKTYGENWDDKFTKVLHEQISPEHIKVNTFKEHRRLWEQT